MKYIRQFGIIIAISFLGEFLHYVFPFPVPASIYGMVIMLALLMSKRLKVEDVKETSLFLIEIMPMMFIPAAVGLLVSWEQLRPILIPVVAITVVSTFVVMIVTGKVTDFLTRDRVEHANQVGKMVQMEESEEAE